MSAPAPQSFPLSNTKAVIDMSLAEITNGSHEGLRTTASTMPNGRKSRNTTEPLSPPEVALPPPAVSLVIPARNEARNIAWVLEQIPDTVDEIILVDGNSTDATFTTASLSARHPGGAPGGNRQGRRAAKWLSRRHWRHYRHDRRRRQYVAPGDPALPPLLANGYDFVKGSRFISGGGSLDISNPASR